MLPAVIVAIGIYGNCRCPHANLRALCFLPYMYAVIQRLLLR